jgi:uncharacterized damage-inducible protein DinB
MRAADLREWFEYNRWANGRVLDTASHLSPDQFTRDLGSSYPSVRDTLVHMLWAEWIWLERCSGVSPMTVFEPALFPDVEAVRARWRPVERGQGELLTALIDTAIRRTVAYTNRRAEHWEYLLGDVLYHVVNHASYHRGQLTTMFRQVGETPVGTDFLCFRDEQGAGAPGVQG